MMWFMLSFFIIFGTTAFLSYTLFNRVSRQKQIVLQNLLTLQEELTEKKNLLAEIAEINIAYALPEDVEELEKKVEYLIQTTKEEKAKISITQTELDSVDLRLRELEEIDKELENSAIEASREFEMLRVQEKDVEGKTLRIKETLDNLFIQMDVTKRDVAEIDGAKESLDDIKVGYEKSRDAIEHFQGKISEINQKYMNLKKAYDALDIEYAQLYEKYSHKD